MRISFRATKAAFVADEDALVCGLEGADAAGAENYVTLIRSPEREDPSEDLGVYVEFDDQINSGYGRVLRCSLTRERLSLDLSGQLGRLASAEGLDVALALDDDLYIQIRIGLPRIFRGIPGALEMAYLEIFCRVDLSFCLPLFLRSLVVAMRRSHAVLTALTIGSGELRLRSRLEYPPTQPDLF